MYTQAKCAPSPLEGATDVHTGCTAAQWRRGAPCPLEGATLQACRDIGLLQSLEGAADEHCGGQLPPFAH